MAREFTFLFSLLAALAAIFWPDLWLPTLFPSAPKPPLSHTNTACNKSQSFLQHYASVTCIQVQYWPLNLAYVEEARVPLVIKQSPAAEMAAVRKWQSRSYLVENVPMLTQIRVGASRIFSYFDAEKRARWVEAFPALERDRAGAVVNMSTAAFFENVSADVQNLNWLYYSRRLELDGDDEFEKLKEDLDLGFLMQDIDQTKVSANIWSAAKGVITNTHYDGQNNYFVQVVGTKTFVLSPPDTFRDMRLFPKGHPSDRQSQLIPEIVPGAEQAKKAHPFSSIPALVADLEPGDVLYVPPMWFHRVYTTQSAGIGVNLWVPAMEDQLPVILRKNAKLPAVLESTPSPETDKRRVAVGVKLLRSLANIGSQKIRGGQRKSNLLKDLYAYRFEMLKDASGCHDKADKEKCPKKVAALESKEAKEIEDMVEAAKSILDEAEERIGEYGSGVRDLMLTDFIESVADHVIGASDVCLFLFCAAQEDAWSKVA